MKKLISAIIALGFSVGVNAACDTKSLKGDYYFNAVGNDNGFTCANVGVANFDGKGNVKTTTVSGCGFQTQQTQMTGTYKIESNCLGYATGENGFVYTFVMNKALTNGSMFVSQNGVIGTGVVVKQ